MSKYTTFILLAFFSFLFSSFITNFEKNEFELTGVVYCDKSPCPKVYVYYLKNTEKYGAYTGDNGSFFINYSGKSGDDITIYFQSVKKNDETCNAPSFNYKIKELSIYESIFGSFMGPFQRTISKIPFQMDCQDKAVIQVNNPNGNNGNN